MLFHQSFFGNNEKQWETTRNNDRGQPSKRSWTKAQRLFAALWEVDHHWVVQLLWPEPNSIVRMEILCYLWYYNHKLLNGNILPYINVSKTISILLSILSKWNHSSHRRQAINLRWLFVLVMMGTSRCCLLYMSLCFNTNYKSLQALADSQRPIRFQMVGTAGAVAGVFHRRSKDHPP